MNLSSGALMMQVPLARSKQRDIGFLINKSLDPEN
jgi:hypothetical protein